MSVPSHGERSSRRRDRSDERWGGPEAEELPPLPREMVLASAGSGKTYRLSSRLIGLDAVQRINFEREHNGILMETFQPDLVYDKLAEIVVEEEIEVELMTSPDDNVQAVFEYLTHGRTEETS